jgi:UDP-N-acetylmuramoyl-tripeptide--D-alanyl-D-alanine ligase
MGMNHAGEIDRLAQIARPNISIITNVGDAHIEYLGSRENIARAKAELLPHTDPNGYVLLNGDDPYVTKMVQLYTGTKYVYSLRNKADIYATEVQAADSGMFFRLHIGEESVSCYLPMYGFHNVSNLLPAALIAFKNGMQLEEIRDALLDMTISDMRFKVLRGPGDSILINDAYNASPSSMKAALDTFQHVYPGRRKVVVLGDIYELGHASERLHTEVGQYLARKPFEVITVGEDASYISSAAGGRHATSKEDAVNMLRPYLCAEYALLFKASRGMALETLIDDLRNEVQYT